MNTLVNIDIRDYMTDEEIKQCCYNALQVAVWDTCCADAEKLNTFIGNQAYMFIWRTVDEALGGGLSDRISSKVSEAIESIGTYTIFRSKDNWHPEDSVGQKILDEEVSAARPLIKARVESIIANYPFHELDHGEIGDVVYECIMNKLFSKEDDQCN